MTTLLYKRVFNLNGKSYLYKREQTAPNEVQKMFGMVTDADRNNRLDFIPRTGITHKVCYDETTNKPVSFEKMHKQLNDYGSYELTEESSVRKSEGKLPYWVTLKGNKFETAYISADKSPLVVDGTTKTNVIPRVYEGQAIGYDKEYINSGDVVLKYSYFPNMLDPRMKNAHPVKDTLDENSIIFMAKRLINRLSNLAK